MQTTCPSVGKGFKDYAFSPMVGNRIFLPFTYHSPRSCLFPLHLGHHIARLVMTQMMLSEKSLQTKKKFPLPSRQSPPSHQLQTRKCNFKIHKFTKFFEAYLNILFCSRTKEKYFPTLKRKTCLHTTKNRILLDNIKATISRNPFGNIKPLLCSEAPIVALSYI